GPRPSACRRRFRCSPSRTQGSRAGWRDPPDSLRCADHRGGRPCRQTDRRRLGGRLLIRHRLRPHDGTQGSTGVGMRIDVVSLFPAMFAAIGEHGITARALERGLWSLERWNPRDFTHDAYRRVDDRPYGGGPGMVMLAEPLAAAIAAASEAQQLAGTGPLHRIYLSPQGRPLTPGRVIEQ